MMTPNKAMKRTSLPVTFSACAEKNARRRRPLIAALGDRELASVSWLAIGSGPGKQTRDGCSVELYKLTPYNGELEPLRGILGAYRSVLELGSGVGRLTCQLLEWGLEVTAVDNSAEMLKELPSEVHSVQSNIEDLELETVFDVVLLASYIINTPDLELRSGILGCAKRHLEPDGVFLVQSQDPNSLAQLEPGRESTSNGITTRVESVHKRGGTVRATISYQYEDQVWIHEFDAAVLERSELESEFKATGLRLQRWIDSDIGSWAVVIHI